MTRFGDHDVVVVPVTNSQDVSGHTVPGAREHKGVHRLFVILICRVLGANPLLEGSIPEGCGRTAVSLLDVGHRLGIQNNLDHPNFVSGGNATVRNHAQIQVLLLPKLKEEEP